MTRELDAISVNVYADLNQVIETAAAAERELEAVVKRARSHEIKFQVGLNSDSVRILERDLDTIVSKERDFELKIRAKPEKASKAQFKTDIENAVNKGEGIRVKTKVQLDRTNINSMREHIKDALKSIRVPVDVYGVWKGWEGGEPPTEFVNVRGRGGPSGSGSGGGAAPDDHVKTKDEATARAAQPNQPLKEEKAPTKQTSSTVVGGPAGTTRTTQETASKTTVESKPAPGTQPKPRIDEVDEVIPKVKQTKPSAKNLQPQSTDFNSNLRDAGLVRSGRDESNPAQGATVLAGKHAGGGGEVVTAGQQRVAKNIEEAKRQFAEDATELLKAFNIGFNPAATIIDPVSGSKRPVAHLDFSGMKYPKLTPATMTALSSMGVNVGAPEEEQLEQLRTVLEDTLDEYNAVKYTKPPSSEEVREDFMGTLLGLPSQRGTALRPGKGGMRTMNPRAWMKLFGGTDLTPEQRAELDKQRQQLLFIGRSDEFGEKDLQGEDMRHGYTREDLRLRKRAITRKEELRAALESGESLTIRTGKNEERTLDLPEFTRMAELAADPDKPFLGGGISIDPFTEELVTGQTNRDVAISMADFLENQLAGAFPRQMATLRKGGESRQPAVNVAFEHIQNVRSLLGRSSTGQSLTGRRADEDLRELEASQKRAESAFTTEKLEEFVNLRGFPPSMLTQHPFMKDFQRIVLKRRQERVAIADAERELKKNDREALAKIQPDKKRGMLQSRLAEIETNELPNVDTDRERQVLTNEMAELRRQIEARPPRTRREHLQRTVDKGLSSLPSISATAQDEFERDVLRIARDDTAGPIEESQWSKDFTNFLKKHQDELEKKVGRAREPSRKMRKQKPLDPLEMEVRRGEIQLELLEGASGKHAEALRAELKEITEALGGQKAMTRVQQIRAELDRLSEPAGENDPTPSIREIADKQKAYDLKRAELLDAEADEMAEEVTKLGKLPKNERTEEREARMRELEGVIGSKRERAAGIRAPHKEPEVEESAAMQYLKNLAGDVEVSDEEIQRRRGRITVSDKPYAKVPKPTTSTKQKKTEEVKVEASPEPAPEPEADPVYLSAAHKRAAEVEQREQERIKRDQERQRADAEAAMAAQPQAGLSSDELRIERAMESTRHQNAGYKFKNRLQKVLDVEGEELGLYISRSRMAKGQANFGGAGERHKIQKRELDKLLKDVPESAEDLMFAAQPILEDMEALGDELASLGSSFDSKTYETVLSRIQRINTFARDVDRNDFGVRKNADEIAYQKFPPEKGVLNADVEFNLNPDDAGEGPGATVGGGRGERNRLNIATASARSAKVEAELAKITSPQMATGMLRRTVNPVTVAQAEAAQRYLRGERAGTALGGGGGGGVVRVHVQNFSELKGMLVGAGIEGAGTATAASPIVPLQQVPPSGRARRTARRVFAGDVPPDFPESVFDALEGDDEAPFDADEVAKRAERTREFIKQREDLLVSRAPTVALGQAFQTLLGGRPEVQIAIRQAKQIETEIDTRLRRIQRRNEEDIPKELIARARAEERGDAKGIARSQERIERLQIDTAFDQKKIVDLEESLPEIRAEFESLNPVVRSFATLTAGAIGGTLIFGATLAAAEAAIQGVGYALGPTVERLTGYASTAAAVNNAVADAIRQHGGYSKSVIAATTAQAGFSDEVAASIGPALEQSAAIRAGNKALADQIDLIRTVGPGAEPGFFHPEGTVRGLTTGTGGFLGSPIFQDPGQLQQLTKLLPGGDDLGRNFPLTRAILEWDQPLNFVGAITGAIEEGRKRRLGQLTTDETLAQVNQGNDAIQVVRLADIDPQARDAFKEAQEQAFRDAAIPEPEREVFRQSGSVFVRRGPGGTFAPIGGGGDLLSFLENSARSRIQQDPDQLLARDARGIEFQQIARRAQSDFTRQFANPIQRAIQQLAAPRLPITAGVPGGLFGAMMSGETGTLITGLRSEQRLEAREAAGREALLNLVPPDQQFLVKGLMTDLEGLGKQAAGIRLRLLDQQTEAQLAQTDNSLRIMKRTIGELQGSLNPLYRSTALLANTGQIVSASIGQMTARQIQLGRDSAMIGLESNQIQLGINERQLNLQEAMAGLGVAGETPEERGLRLKATQEEIADQRRLLENAQEQQQIQEEAVPLGFVLEDARIRQQIDDLGVQVSLALKERELVVDSRAAENTLSRLDAEIEATVADLQTYVQEGTQAWMDGLSQMGQMANETAADFGELATKVADAFGITVNLKDLLERISDDNYFAPGQHDQDLSEGTGANQGRYASGGLFDTNGPTQITVGEAGTETVAVLRNPRSMFANMNASAGGVTMNINVTGNTVRSDNDIAELVRRISNEVQYSLAQQAALRGLRSPA